MAVVSAVRAAVAATLRPLGPGLFGVACSGGADSMALADAAIDVAGAAHVVVLVIDHGLHPRSAQVAGEVAAWARGRGAAAVVRRVEVGRRASLEAAAREARYAALDALVAELGLAAVLVGHTARDQAETVLMRVLRGTGPAGLAGIPARRGAIVRPLLALDRVAIEAHVRARGLPTWDDPMNEDRSLTRVRVRAELLPALRRENPQLDRALLRLARSAAEWTEVLDAAAAPHARFPIDCPALAALPAAIRKRALALALEAAGLDHDAVHLDALDRLVVAPTRGERTLDLPACRLVRSYDRLAPVAPEASAEAPDALAVPAGYVIRAWQPGDRMRPTRLRGRSRKLSDLYIDAKLPRARRGAARVVVRTSDAEIIWAEFLGFADASVITREERERLIFPARSGGVF